MKNSIISEGLVIGAALLALGGCATGPQHEKTAGQAVDDSVITTKVKTAFVEDKQVSALNISVHTDKGVVKLSGTAKDSQESWKAADLARQVDGVKAVRNDIVVR